MARRDLMRAPDEEADEDYGGRVDAEIHRGDNRETRGRYHDDKVWGGSYTSSYTTPAALLPSVQTVGTNGPGELVRLTLRPARAVALSLIWTPVSTDKWDADGGTYDLQWIIGFGVGRNAETITVDVPGLVAPFTQRVNAPPFVLPVRTLYVTAKLLGIPTAASTTYVSRFSAFAAPYFNHPSDEG